jgi:hypothetical protein
LNFIFISANPWEELLRIQLQFLEEYTLEHFCESLSDVLKRKVTIASW